MYMKLRKIGKMNKPNDGNRSLYESIFNRHVLTALKYLSHNDIEFLIIGDLAISYHVKPFATKRIQILVKDKTNMRFKYFKNNKCRNIELVISDISDFNMNIDQYNYAINTSYISDNFKISSPTFLMNIFLLDIQNIDNRADAYTICSNSPIKTYELFWKKTEYENFIYSIKQDYNMSFLKNFDDYFKCRIYEGNSGYPEVDRAFKDWLDNTKNIEQVLIGGMAIVNYDIERTTTDVDFLFLTSDDIPETVYGFKKHRRGAFQHNKTHVEVEVLDDSIIPVSSEFVAKIFETAYQKQNFKIASPSAIVALKLSRFNDRDIKDIKSLVDNYNVDISIFEQYLSKEEIDNYLIVTKK